MVLAEQLVVLFAKSGIGKTSLINAGIIQQLRKRGYIPFKVRLNDPMTNPVQMLYDQIKQTVSNTDVEFSPGSENSLWQFFKTAEFWSNEDQLLTPVLILDQFEELFTLHSQKHRDRFIIELADLIRVRGHQIRDEASKSKDDFSYSESLPDVKIIISIREDFLAQLEEMANQIPAILQNRFRMLPLNRNQAKLAIEEPARLEDEHIHIAQFHYAPETVEAMLNFLCKRTARKEAAATYEVEPFQLQLLCQHIEGKVRKRTENEAAKILIKPEDLGGDEGMRQVLKDFYNKQIQRVKPGWKKKNVRKLCQKGLISETDRRLSLEEEEIERKYNVTKSILIDLVDRRLLRSEPRVGSVYYELSHDTLVTSIRKSQIERKKRSARIGGLLLAIIVVLVFGFFFTTGRDFYHEIYSDLKYNQAKKLKNKGEISEAEEKYKKLLKFNQNYPSAYEDLGSIYIENGRLIEAKELFKDALEREVKSVTIYHFLGKVCEKEDLVEETIRYYEKAIEELSRLSEDETRINTRVFTDFARFLATQREFGDAVNYYKLAIRHGDKNVYTFKELAKLYADQEHINEAIENYNDAIANGDKSSLTFMELAKLHIKNGDYDETVEVYKFALKVNPENLTIFKDLVNKLNREEALDHSAEIYKIAFDAYINAQSLDQRSSDAYRWLARYFIQKDEIEQAIMGYEHIVELDPEYAYLYDYLIHGIKGSDTNNHRTKIYQIAFNAYLNLQRVDRRNADAYSRLAIYYIEKGEIAQAVKGYEHIVESDPENAYIYAGLVKELKNREADKEINTVYRTATDAYKKLLDRGDRKSSTYRGLANLYIAKDEFPQAIKIYSEGVKANPRNAQIYDELVSFLKKKNADSFIGEIYKIATQAYENLKDNGDRKPITYRRLISLYMVQNRYKQAVDVFSRGCDVNPRIATLYNDLARQLKEPAADEQMIRLHRVAADGYEKLLVIGDKNLIVYRELIKLYVNQKNYAKAVDAYLRAVETSWSNVDLYDYLIGELQKVNAEAEIAKVYGAAEATYTKLLDMSDNKSSVYRNLGRLYIARKQFENAVQTYQQAIETNPKDAYLYRDFVANLKEYDAAVYIDKIYSLAANVESQKSSYYRNLGDELFKKKKFDIALQNYHHAIKANPEDESAYLRLGATQLQLRSYGLAIQSLKKTLALDNKTEGAYGALGTALTKKGRYWEGIEALKKGLNQKFTNKIFQAQTFNNMAFVINKLGINYKEAIEYLKDAEKLNQNQVNIFVYSNLGYSYMELNDYEAAQKKLDQALKFTDSDTAKISIFSPAPYKNLGRLQYKKANNMEAIEILENAKKMGPYYVDTHYNLGLAYLKNGEGWKVDQLYREAVEQDPENIDFKRHYIEVFLGSKDFQKAYAIANEILDENELSAEMQLWARVTSFSALLFQGKHSRALGELQTFMADYKVFSANENPFQIAVKWKYVVNEKGSGLAEKDKNLIFALIEILESPRHEANKKFTMLEASLPELTRG
jgi:tetratricopeptide (TPR) repeat protein